MSSPTPTTTTAAAGAGLPPDSLVLRNEPRVEMPTLIYGIAFKREATTDLVYKALEAGYRGVDSANWPRTYDEPRASEGVRRAIIDGVVSRKDLFIQSKFTPCYPAERKWIPYNPDQPIEGQVDESISQTLAHFTMPGEEPYLDSAVLHLPYPDPADTLVAYKALLKYVPHTIHQVGVSNFSLAQLEQLESDCAAEAILPPAVVQNRFVADAAPGHDAGVRALCRQRGIAYQAFGAFAGSKDLLGGKAVERVAREAGVDAVGAMNVLIMALGWVAVLDGTSSPGHMASNLEARGKVVEWAEGSEEGRKAWDECLRVFKVEVGEEQ